LVINVDRRLVIEISRIFRRVTIRVGCEVSSDKIHVHFINRRENEIELMRIKGALPKKKVKK